MGNKEVLQQWIDKANEDLRSAEYLSTMHHPTPDETICFHCQQSSEKYLKAFLFLHNVEPPKIHKLLELMEMCENFNSSFSFLFPQLNVLTDYAVMPRYPNELIITNEDMKIAINYAKIVQEFVLKIIDEKLESNEKNEIN